MTWRTSVPFIYDCVRTKVKYDRTYLFLLFFLRSILLLMVEKQEKTSFRILALGDSHTAGYYKDGLAYHPYATHLTHLFGAANIPVQIDQRGVSGERVVPNMVNRLRSLLKTDASYNWIIILGGSNDLDDDVSAENIFKEGLEPMYDMCLNHTQTKIKLATMTVMENAYDLPTEDDDKDRQALNRMIRDYVAKTNEQDRICLVDLDKGIPYHTASNDIERQQIWDDSDHLTPTGYDRMAVLAFDAIKNKI